MAISQSPEDKFLQKTLLPRLKEKIDSVRGRHTELSETLGISKSAFSKRMNGEITLNAYELTVICNELNISSDWVLGLEKHAAQKVNSEATRISFKDDPSVFLNRIWNENKTLQMEQTADVIWVATPDFLWEYDDSAWQKLIHDNIASRGVRYYTLYKNTAVNRFKVQAIHSALDKTVGAVWKEQCLHIPTDNFPWYTEHVYYNPLAANNSHLLMIMQPLDWGVHADGNVELSVRMATIFARWFATEWNARVNSERWKIESPFLDATEN
jgi:transcriptional regulator with XRE-family HTH domain